VPVLDLLQVRAKGARCPTDLPGWTIKGAFFIHDASRQVLDWTTGEVRLGSYQHRARGQKSYRYFVFSLRGKLQQVYLGVGTKPAPSTRPKP